MKPLIQSNLRIKLRYIVLLDTIWVMIISTILLFTDFSPTIVRWIYVVGICIGFIPWCFIDDD